jgi:hypothetical protein
LHRPLAALVLGLLPAARIGLLWGLAAPPLPAAVTAALGLPSPVAWAAAVMALWGIMGLIRGFAQPSAWPVHYAARRWLLYLAIAAPLMAVLGMAAAWWWQLSFGTSPGAPGVLMMRAALVGLALATLPATLASLRRWPEPVILKPKSALPMPSIDDDRTAYGERWPWLRQHARGAAWGSLGFIVLAMILIFVPQLARLDWQEVRSRQQITGAQTWVETQWLQLNVGANRLVDRFYLTYYDHRAPLVPSPEPPADQGPTPAASGGQ